jgi:Ca-activated chloride channel homolog
MRAVVTALFVALALALPGAQPSFRAGVELVTVPLTVQPRDANAALPTLTADDFRVYEDGDEQRITVAGIDRRPVSLALALDVSGSMTGARQELAAAALRSVFSVLDSRDELALAVFTGDVAVPMPWAPVAEVPGIEWPQWVLAPTKTALLDAVMETVGLMDTASEARHVALVVSDGFDVSSTTSWAALVKTRRQSETEVYAFHVAPWRERQSKRRSNTIDGVTATPGRDVMGEIVGDSGGLVHVIDTPDGAFRAALALGHGLRNQYLIGFETTRPLDGKYRRLKVEATNRQLLVRHRGGYLALAGK